MGYILVGLPFLVGRNSHLYYYLSVLVSVWAVTYEAVGIETFVLALVDEYHI